MNHSLELQVVKPHPVQQSNNISDICLFLGHRKSSVILEYGSPVDVTQGKASERNFVLPGS